MFKGLCVSFTVIATTFFSVSISGYWAFGNLAQSSVFSNFMVNGIPLVPKWFILMSNVFALLQVLAVTVIYLQPTNEIFEKKFADPKSHQFSIRNIMPRLISRSFSVIVATLIAAMFPFFGDIMAFIGAVGCIPLDSVLPMILYNVTFQPSKRGLIFWINTFIAIIFSGLMVLGAISSVRQIILDSKTYHLFANL
ncbi:GABA transporter 1-like [Telopea speciosissima]|uniref:GABA transporter 1-like n=1 Tax=Telopea speciosissima TaxID=54955 RepID=UPI001CC36C2A|nr:GABA transporter 1-like [Telopea speciosissima]